MALIGTNHWNPSGESMWSIVSRLSLCNHLNWVEVRRLFGAKNLRSFSDPTARDPDIEQNFAIPALCVGTGWSTDVFQASFSNWYQPPWISDKERIPDRKSGKYLRVCPSCLAEGSHFLLHQLEDWVRCPIHDEPLTTRCPNCQNLLGQFAIAKPMEGAGCCPHCQERALNYKSKSIEHQQRRLQVIGGYKKWMRSLQAAFDSDNGQYRWMGGKATMQELVHLHELIPGPDWVNRCMADGNRVRRSTWSWSGDPVDEGSRMQSHRIPRDAVRLLYDDFRGRKKVPAVVVDFSSFLSRGVQSQHEQLVKRLGLSCKRSGIQEWNSTECTPLYGEHVDVWDTAYWMWRRNVDEAFPLRQRWSRSRTLDPIQMSWIWESWRRSIGALIWSPLKSLRQPCNGAFVRWLTAIWLARVSEETFGLFAGVACRKIGCDWMNTNWLIDQVSEVGNESFWVRAKDDANNEMVHALSTVAPIQAFLDLKQAGFTGIDNNYCESFERLGPLIELLGTHPRNIYQWESHWRAVRKRQRTRRSALLDSRKASKYEQHAAITGALKKRDVLSDNNNVQCVKKEAALND